MPTITPRLRPTARKVLLALGTPWGLVRHRWVLTKFVLTAGAATASIFALRPRLHDAAGLVAGAGGLVDLGFLGHTLVIAPSVALVLYLATTALSVFKPWGRTRWDGF